MLINRNRNIFSHKFYFLVVVILFIFLYFNERIKAYIYFYGSHIASKEIHEYWTLVRTFYHLKETGLSCYNSEMEEISKSIKNEINDSGFNVVRITIHECTRILPSNHITGVLVYSTLSKNGKVSFINYAFFVSRETNGKYRIIMRASKDAA